MATPNQPSRPSTLFVVFFLSALAVAPAISNAAIIHVSKDGNGSDPSTWAGALQTIGAAVQSATSGDRIWVRQGIYAESVLIETPGLSILGGFSGVENDEQESLRDWETNKTTVNATGLNDTVIRCDVSFTVDGLTIIGGYKAGIGTLSNSDQTIIKIRHCVITGNHPFSGGGIAISSANAEISNCSIMENVCDWDGGGIYILNHSAAIIADCEISRNHSAVAGGGIKCLDSTMMLDNCMIENNRADSYAGAMRLSFSSTSFHNCLF